MPGDLLSGFVSLSAVGVLLATAGPSVIRDGTVVSGSDGGESDTNFAVDGLCEISLDVTNTLAAVSGEVVDERDVIPDAVVVLVDVVVEPVDGVVDVTTGSVLDSVVLVCAFVEDKGVVVDVEYIGGDVNLVDGEDVVMIVVFDDAVGVATVVVMFTPALSPDEQSSWRAVAAMTNDYLRQSTNDTIDLCYDEDVEMQGPY